MITYPDRGLMSVEEFFYSPPEIKLVVPVKVKVKVKKKPKKRRRKKAKVLLVKKVYIPKPRKYRGAWFRYRTLVWGLTEEQPLHKLVNFNRRAYMGWHVDHQISIYQGFKQNISAESIAHISNLKMLPRKVNMRKGRRSTGQTIIF